MTEMHRDPTGGHIDLSENTVKHKVRGLPRDAAMHLFNMIVEKGYAVSVKHMGGFYFIEVPVRLVGDPAYRQEAEIQALAFRAGCSTLQTGSTLRIIG